jgi:hypothetical protein
MLVISSGVCSSKLYQIIPFLNYLQTIVIRETAAGVGSACHEGTQYRLIRPSISPQCEILLDPLSNNGSRTFFVDDDDESLGEKSPLFTNRSLLYNELIRSHRYNVPQDLNPLRPTRKQQNQGSAFR